MGLIEDVVVQPGVAAPPVRGPLTAALYELLLGAPTSEGYVLLRISKVMEADASEKTPDVAQRIGSTLGAAQYQAFVASLRARADIEVRNLSPEKK